MRYTKPSVPKRGQRCTYSKVMYDYLLLTDNETVSSEHFNLLTPKIKLLKPTVPCYVVPTTA